MAEMTGNVGKCTNCKFYSITYGNINWCDKHERRVTNKKKIPAWCKNDSINTKEESNCCGARITVYPPFYTGKDNKLNGSWYCLKCGQLCIPPEEKSACM